MLKVGSKVTYHTPYKTEIGVVKEITDTCIFVVFNCAGVWEHYAKYTAQCVPKEDSNADLLHGWYEVDETNNLSFEDWCSAYSKELWSSDDAQKDELYELYIKR